MISKIKLKFGRTPESPNEEIQASPITIFVGPNNSGKSKVLSEIASFCHTGAATYNTVILEELIFEGLSKEKTEIAIDSIKKTIPSEILKEGYIRIGGLQDGGITSYDTLTAFIRDPHVHLELFCQNFLTHSTRNLDGRSRITLVDPQPAGDLQQAPHTSLQVLLRDDLKRHEVRRIVYEAFGSYFVIDPTNLGQLQIRLSAKPPINDMEERGIHTEAVEFHSKAQLIDHNSDGVKAFTGIVTEIIAGDPKIVLIDEPEAFLHPPLASKLGYEISRAALATDKRVFISTHSPAFIMGCIHSGAPVNIVRLTYRNGVATSRVLHSRDILELMRNPLLRSTGVLSGLFYEFVVVTESDADRAFYQEINERLLRFEPEKGIPNCLFINAQNKQTVHTIIRPLRQLGIPTVGIVDIDILKEGGRNWTNILTAAGIPAITHNALAATRVAVKAALEATGLDMKRDGGIDILKPAEREAAVNLLEQLADYGVFVVPTGELESWLKSTNTPGHGPAWLIEIFKHMGDDLESAEFMKPTEGDVWEFLSKIRAWNVDLNRKGIPT